MWPTAILLKPELYLQVLVASMFAAASLGAASANHPSPAPQPTVSHLCVTVRTGWGGTLEETREIGRNPVPDSFRRPYASSGCERFQLGVSDLITWHLAFGDERSTAAALQFLAETQLQAMPSTERFDRELPRALMAARRPHPTASAGARLQKLVDEQGRFIFLAGQYLRAAETFRSPALLDAGARFLEPLGRGLEVLYGGRRIALADDGDELPGVTSLTERPVNEIRDLQMGYALARAQLSGSAADLRAAETVVAENFDPVARAAAGALLRDGRDLCESPFASGALKQACEKENDVRGRLGSVWLADARLELLSDGKVVLAATAPFTTFDVAMAAIAADDRLIAPTIFRDSGAAGDKASLFVARAEELERQSRGTASLGEDYRLRSSALNALELAERLTPVVLNPNRFRRIAETFLRIFASMPPRPTPSTEDIRWAVYLRTTLNGLSGIAEGRLPAPKSAQTPR